MIENFEGNLRYVSIGTTSHLLTLQTIECVDEFLDNNNNIIIWLATICYTSMYIM